MIVVFWALAGAALALAVLQLVIALRLSAHMTPRAAADGFDDLPAARSRPAISALVPLKGAPAGLEERLQRLLRALRDGDQLVLALETADDPAHVVATAIRAAGAACDVAIVLSGPAGDRMGKQHNLSAALGAAKHRLIAFMDDDVLIEAADLDEAAAAVETDGNATGEAPVGAAFAMPYYGAGKGAGVLSGGAIVAAYTNHAFSPNMAALALQAPPTFIIACFWMASRTALDAIGGLESFTATASDDAAIGRAFHAAGRRNVLLRRPVRLAPERLDLMGGLAHILKWLTLLRAEGLGVLLMCFLTWHPLVTGLLAGLLALVAPSVTLGATLAVLVALVALRALAVLTLEARVFGLRPPGRYLPAQLAYELLIAPWLFPVAAFRREITWRGRRYRLGTGGVLTQSPKTGG